MKQTRVRIQKLKEALRSLKPMLPGGISEQRNVCGKGGCRCKDPKKPRLHGPYYQLSFTLKGKSSSFFVRKEDLAEARRRIARYKEFKELSMALIRAYVELAREEGLKVGDRE